MDWDFGCICCFGDFIYLVVKFFDVVWVDLYCGIFSVDGGEYVVWLEMYVCDYWDLVVLGDFG